MKHEIVKSDARGAYTCNSSLATKRASLENAYLYALTLSTYVTLVWSTSGTWVSQGRKFQSKVAYISVSSIGERIEFAYGIASLYFRMFH